MTELLGRKEIEALSRCKITEFKKCTKCGKKYKIRTKENFEYCGKCGARLKFYVNELLGIDRPATGDTQEILKRQWMEALGPGWPCEVWDTEESEIMRYFSVFKDDYFYFCEFKGLAGKNGFGTRYYNFRPLSTPLDFAPVWATEIKINSDGNFKFYSQCIDGNAPCMPNYLNWPNCPKGMRDKTFRIPDDWRPK